MMAELKILVQMQTKHNNNNYNSHFSICDTAGQYRVLGHL